MRTNPIFNKICCSVIILFFSFQLFGQLTRLHEFNGIEGRYPISEIVYSADTLFGTTIQGGDNWSGTLFRINSDGTNFKNLYTFGNINGLYPCGPLFLKGSTLYGTTQRGGKYGKGNLFKFDVNGNKMDTLFSFRDTLGVSPESPFIVIGDTIFGTTTYGGKFNQGVLFRINLDGTHYKKLAEFGASTGNPCGTILFYNNYLYGTTSGLMELKGTIYRIRTNGSDYEILHEFSGLEVAIPTTSLLLVDNTMYGGACRGNTSANIYKIKPDGTGYEVVFDFPSSDNVLPQNNLTYWNGSIFGLSFGIKGIFRVSTDGNDYNMIHVFRNNEGSVNSFGSLLLKNDCLYGMTRDGGAKGYGLIYKYNLIATTPDIQAKEVKATEVDCSQMKISWARGNGTHCAVFVREGKSESFPVANNTAYTANDVFGKGSQINTSGWYCVYNGTDMSVTVTGLKPVTNYQIMVSEYNVALKGDEKYNIQQSVNNPIEQKTIKCSQYIFMDVLPIEAYGDIGFYPEGRASSGLNVSYTSSNTNVAVIQSNFIRIMGIGETNITASQSGNDIYFSATDVTRTLKVNKALLTVTAVDTMREVGDPNPAFRLTYRGFIGAENKNVLIQKPTATCNANVNSPAGSYAIVVSGGQSNNYNFKYVNGILTVSAPTAINEGIPDKVKIYPNPTDGQLFFEKENPKADHIRISDISGKILMDRMIETDHIDVSFLSSGLYFIKINDSWYKFQKN